MAGGQVNVGVEGGLDQRLPISIGHLVFDGAHPLLQHGARFHGGLQTATREIFIGRNGNAAPSRLT